MSGILASVFAIAIAAGLPFVTARLLAAIFLRGAPGGGEERARRLAPFRTAAMLAGFAQIQVAWIAGASALDTQLGAVALGMTAAAIAFVMGGVARRVEEPPHARSSALGAALLRLRILPWFLGPGLAAGAASALPVLDGASIRWPFAALSLLLCAFGVAYGGLLALLATRAIRPATPEVRALARDVAAREQTSLALVLRLPTPGVRFANAAAIPWARAMIVTDSITELLSADELRAVLAHEAGHLSEPPIVLLARLGGASLLVFTLTTGTRLAEARGLDPTFAGIGGLALAAVFFLLVRKLARRMEERADARALATVGGAPLAAALTKLHAYAQMPMVTGARRVHPDLFDRLAALGVETGPRPQPPPRRSGVLVGLVLAAILIGGGFWLSDAWALRAADRTDQGP
jgi:Zn-dependent protease with chaperone function